MTHFSLKTFCLIAVCSAVLHGCGSKSDPTPANSDHGSVTYEGKTSNFLVVTDTHTSSAISIGGNAYSSDSSYSIAMAVLSIPSSGSSLTLGSTLSIILEVAPKSGSSGFRTHYYASPNDKITYTSTGGKDVFSGTNLHEVSLTDGTEISGAPTMSFTLKQ